jgi:hypothetical protein
MSQGAGGFLKGDISEKNTTEFGRWSIFRIRSNDRLMLGTVFRQNSEKRPPFPGRHRYRLLKSLQPPGNVIRNPKLLGSALKKIIGEWFQAYFQSH